MLGLRTLNGLDKDHVFSVVPQAIKEGIESKLNTFLKDEILLSTNNIISPEQKEDENMQVTINIGNYLTSRTTKKLFGCKKSRCKFFSL